MKLSCNEEMRLHFHNFVPKDTDKLLLYEVYKKQIVSLFVRKTLANLKALPKLEELCNFDIKNAVQATVQEQIGAQAARAQEGQIDAQAKSILVYAPTQAGKTARKAVEIACLLTMEVPIVLVTKGKTECNGLAWKLSDYLDASTEGSAFEKKIFCVYDHSEDEITSAFKESLSGSGCIVIPDTYKQIGHAHNVMEEVKRFFKSRKIRFSFALIMDECDAIENRSLDRDEKNELEMKKLKLLGPIVEVRVTATPMPTLRDHLENPGANTLPTLLPIKPKANYVGVESLVPPGYPEAPSFIDVSSLEKGFNYTMPLNKKGNKKTEQLFRKDTPLGAKQFPGQKTKRIIPFWNDQCNKLLDDVFEGRDWGAKGHLVLVATSPWTKKKPGNIFEQAAYVQDLYYSKGKQFITVCVHATTIAYRLPGQKTGFECEKNTTICNFLNAIDGNRKFGLEMPVVIFGYNKLKRSISYRSNRRVPTHAIFYHRQGQSIENVRQSIGRATFNGKELLEQNVGWTCVILLVPEEDYYIMKQYDAMTLKCWDLVKNGNIKSWEDIEHQIPKEENYLLRTKRKTGSIYKNSKPVEGRPKKHPNDLDEAAAASLRSNDDSEIPPVAKKAKVV